LAGRKRKNGPREPNGRLNRAWLVNQDERSAMEPAVTARRRLYGLDETQAKQPEAGYTIGRLVLNRVLRKDQGEAAKRYLEVRNAYQRAIGAVPDFTQPREGFNPSDDPETAWERFCTAARRSQAAMSECLLALMQSERSPAPVAALDAFLVKDVHVAELLGALRLALNALGRHFGIPVVRAEQEAA